MKQQWIVFFQDWWKFDFCQVFDFGNGGLVCLLVDVVVFLLVGYGCFVLWDVEGVNFEFVLFVDEVYDFKEGSWDFGWNVMFGNNK